MTRNHRRYEEAFSVNFSSANVDRRRKVRERAMFLSVGLFEGEARNRFMLREIIK